MQAALKRPIATAVTTAVQPVGDFSRAQTTVLNFLAGGGMLVLEVAPWEKRYLIGGREVLSREEGDALWPSQSAAHPSPDDLIASAGHWPHHVGHALFVLTRKGREVVDRLRAEHAAAEPMGLG